MKKIIYRFPFLSRILLAIILGCIALMLGGFVYSVFPIRPWFPFAGEAFLLLFTLVLYRTEKHDLPPLGLRPSLKNIAYLFCGLVIAIAALLGATWLRTLYSGEVWHLSPNIDMTAMAKSLYYVLPSVIVQELMFRGYLFTKTISRLGIVKTNIIFAVLFALVHVVDRDVIQNPPKIIMLGICTAVGHLWFATALLRSKTILFPIGLHLGNNWAVMHLAGMSDNNQSIFYLTDQKAYTTWMSFIILLLIFNVFFLLVTWLTWKSRWPFRAENIA
ncbi:MAG TPA: CPBP family intramembrane glutamic endopeptidase [Flavisolibacter sp.]|jgi:membrane protease YdiL (CAAX protease family)